MISVRHLSTPLLKPDGYLVQWKIYDIIKVDSTHCIILLNLAYVTRTLTYLTPVSVLFTKDRYNSVSYIAILGEHRNKCDFKENVKATNLYTNIISYSVSLLLDKLKINYIIDFLNTNTQHFITLTDKRFRTAIWRNANDIFIYACMILSNKDIKPIDSVFINYEQKTVIGYDIDDKQITNISPLGLDFMYHTVPPYLIANKLYSTSLLINSVV